MYVPGWKCESTSTCANELHKKSKRLERQSDRDIFFFKCAQVTAWDITLGKRIPKRFQRRNANVDLGDSAE